MTSLGERTTTLFDIAMRHGNRPALISGDGTMSYQALTDAATRKAQLLGLMPGRLVALEASASPEFVVHYLAAFAAHSPVLVLPPAAYALIDRYRPHVVVRSDGVAEYRSDRPVECHPDLALSLSTSGSTGAPRLVRLSSANLVANATAIAEYLQLGPDDRAITSLPLHYCYGLSVVHSHLVAGASLVLSAASVVDPCFWHDVERHGVSNLAAVPHTMELLDRVGFADWRLPRLRAVTVAGGRLDPRHVVRWSEIGHQCGWDLYLMYGQTEATARMAYLPPDLAREHPASVGRAIPGGAFEIRPHPAADDPRVGEVVYRGPNVMMGYADDADDLTRGSELTELATGDLGRIDAVTGLLEIVGRVRRFVKPLGVRVDLDQLERRLLDAGIEALCTGTDEFVAVAAVAPTEVVRRTLSQVLALPPGAVRIVTSPELPRLANGKPDHPTVLRLAQQSSAAAAQQGSATDPSTSLPIAVADIVGSVLGGSIDPSRSFVELGGDSLSYVECSVRLSDLLGALPPDWHLVPLARLAATTAPAPSITRHRFDTVSVDTTVALRAIAICAVVATHMQLSRIPFGAHLMLAVSGYNLSRFVLSRRTVAERLRSAGRLLVGVAVPTIAWIGINMAIAGGYSRGSLLLVNNYFGSPWRTDGRWRYWYVEVLIQLVVAATLLVAVPGVRRLHQRFPYGLPLGLLALCLVPRYGLVRWGDEYNLIYRSHWIAWFFVIGWLTQRSVTVTQRAVTTVAIVATIPGFFDRPQREWAIIAGLVLLVWFRQVPVWRRAVPPLTALAAASLWTLLVHWQLWPVLTTVMTPEAAYLPTVAGGVAAWWLAERLRRHTSTWLRSLLAAARVHQHRPAGAPGVFGSA